MVAPIIVTVKTTRTVSYHSYQLSALRVFKCVKDKKKSVFEVGIIQQLVDGSLKGDI
jgi:hypothetical protein